jgi:hypothetical protein
MIFSKKPHFLNPKNPGLQVINPKRAPRNTQRAIKHANLRAMVRISLLPVVGMSWMTIKLGVIPEITLMTFFGIIQINLLKYRRRLRD